MKKPNHHWCPVARCFYYPGGSISVTEEELYASPSAERRWAAIGFVSAMCWFVLGEPSPWDERAKGPYR